MDDLIYFQWDTDDIYHFSIPWLRSFFSLFNHSIMSQKWFSTMLFQVYCYVSFWEKENYENFMYQLLPWDSSINVLLKDVYGPLHGSLCIDMTWRTKSSYDLASLVCRKHGKVHATTHRARETLLGGNWFSWLCQTKAYMVVCASNNTHLALWQQYLSCSLGKKPNHRSTLADDVASKHTSSIVKEGVIWLHCWHCERYGRQNKNWGVGAFSSCTRFGVFDLSKANQVMVTRVMST